MFFQAKCSKCGASRDLVAHNEAHASALFGQMHDPAHFGFITSQKFDGAHGRTVVHEITKFGTEVKSVSCLCQECQNAEG
jgi:hypothetical protein